MKIDSEIQLYTQSNFPVFQNRMYKTESLAQSCPKGDIEIVQNLETGLIYNCAFKPELMIYDSNYQNEQSVSGLFRDHLRRAASIVERLIGKHAIAEIGSGKGAFLELLLADGCDVVGFDPTYEGENPLVKREYFTSTYGHQIEGFVMRHVLEHVMDPVSLLEKIKVANNGTGKIYIEVPCLDWIIEHNAWFDLFYEHVNYFRLDDFKRIFGSVLECGRMFGGQYLYIVADLATLRAPIASAVDLINPKQFVKFDYSYRPRQGIDAAIWGGASKGVIFALLGRRAGFDINIIIDINPAKQGLYLAMTGLQVQSPLDGLSKLAQNSTIFVMNSNYLEEIRRQSNDKYKYVCIDSAFKGAPS
jgi:methyltransferase family protein